MCALIQRHTTKSTVIRVSGGMGSPNDRSNARKMKKNCEAELLLLFGWLKKLLANDGALGHITFDGDMDIGKDKTSGWTMLSLCR